MLYLLLYDRINFGGIMNRQYLIDSANELNIALTDEQVKSFECYFDIVVEKNKQFNLTAITDEKDFVIKHIIDSIAGVSEIAENAKLLDIGAGAGFPSMPIAIVRKDVEVTALDSTAKKMSFLQDTAREIGVDNLHTVSGRAEEMRELFGTFDVVTARAVSSLPILLELAMPMLKVGGVFVAYKTDESELEDVQNALNVLKAKHIATKSFYLPNGDRRAILSFEKIGATPSQYPRQYGTIKKKPL